jgi:hypothetical protein
MSMGMALEGVRDWLRDRNGWTNMECGVMFRCIPPNRAGQKFIAIDDGGVETGPDNTHALTEIYTLEVGIWRRPGHLPKDMLGQSMLPEDLYLPEISTLNDMERRVIFWLHNRWELLTYINGKYGLPDEGRGDNFIEKLSYRGRTKVETAQPDEGQPGLVFIGRKLRFRGLKRIQKITDSLG